MSIAVQRMIAEAVKTLGMSDKGNTVRTPVHTWYNAKFGNPDTGKYAWDWCNGWVTYVAYQSGNEAAVTFSKGFAYTVAHADAFRAKGQWHTGASGIQAGDIVFFDWNGTNNVSAIDHVGLVEKVVGSDVHTIEGNIEDAVRRKVRTEATIAGYGRPKYTADSTPAPTPTPTPTPVGGTVIFEDCGPGGKAAANKVVQSALNKFVPPVTVDGDWGPKTTAAYKKWQESLGFRGADADGKPGITSMTRLAAKYGFTLTRRAPGTPPPPPVVTPPAAGNVALADYQTAPEPAANYARVGYGGRTVNKRTAEILNLAARWAGVTITLTQGSYNAGGVSASAGTHDGGGAVDINVNNWSSATREKVVLCLRKAGMAAWLRTPSEGFAYHIHGIAMGDREASSGAKGQVQSYFNGRNGLANNRASTGETRWPNWADKYNQ